MSFGIATARTIVVMVVRAAGVMVMRRRLTERHANTTSRCRVCLERHRQDKKHRQN